MRILVDSAGGELLPEEIVRLQEQLRSEYAEPLDTELALLGSESEHRMLAGESSRVPRRHRHPLECWLVQAHAYNAEQGARVGILGRLFAGDVKRVEGGVIHDAKRFSRLDSETPGKAIEVGVAVRLSVATSKVDASVELTLPNLAAQAQLSNVDTRIGISVCGYGGHLGSLLPAPRKLDVETYVTYVEAFQKIQALVFGEEGWHHVVPTVLSYEL